MADLTSYQTAEMPSEGVPMNTKDHPAHSLPQPVGDRISQSFSAVRAMSDQMYSEDNDLLHSNLGSNTAYNKRK